MNSLMLVSPWQAHLNRWDNCQRCELATQRSKMCHARGSLPCDVLFIGEAPGESEDALGLPFKGPAGHLLDHIIRQGLPDGVSYALTNLVACFPAEAKKEKINEPPVEAIRACIPRLAEIVAMARPKLIVCVGQLAAKWVRREERLLKADAIRRVDIVHPAAILRANVAQQGLMIQRSIVQLANVLEELDA